MRADITWQHRAQRHGVYVIVALGLVFMYLVFMAGQFKGLGDPNAMDYAQVARNIATGQGFTTDFIKPLSLTRSLSLDRHPDLTYPPIHPWIISLVMRVIGTNDRAAALGSGIPFLLTVPLVFVFALRLFDRRVAWLAVVLYVTNLSILRYSISGLEVCLLSLLVTGLLMVLYQYSQSRERHLELAVAAGVLMALIYLTKYIWVVTLIPVLIYLYYASERRERGRMLLVFVLVFGLAIAPWCYRMQHVSGNPFFTWRWYETTMATLTNPGNTLYRSFPERLTPLPTYALMHPKEIYHKLHAGVAALHDALPRLAGPYVAAFFLVAILVPLGPRNFERIRYLLYAMFGVVFLALIIVMPAPRLLYPLAPLITVIAAGFFYRILLPRVHNLTTPWRRRAVASAVGILILAQALPLALTLTARKRPGAGSAQETVQQLTREVGELVSGPIIADVPWLLAWYSDMTAIWLPRSVQDLQRMQDQIGQVRWMLLTPFVSGTKEVERTEEWARVRESAVLREIEPYYGFVVHRRLGNGSWVLFQKIPTAPPTAAPGEGSPAATSSGSE